MADTEQTNETEPTAGADETTGAEVVADVEETVAEDDAAGAEAAAAAATTAEADDTAAEAPAEPEAEDTAAAAEAAEAEASADASTEAAAEEPSEAAEAVAAEAAPADEAAATDEGPGDQPAAPEHTFEELKGKTVVQLREIAEGLGDVDALHGYTTMHKEELLVALCTALGIEAHEHHEVVGIDKTAVKAKIRALKQEREALIAAKDAKQLRIVRRRIRSLKRKIHKATV